MKRIIERMTRYGQTYAVALDCGHVVTRLIKQAEEDQLFIGKRMPCEQCPEESQCQ